MNGTLRYAVQNELAVARTDELIELSWSEIAAALALQPEGLVVRELGGQELAAQAVDENDDQQWDVLVVRVSLNASETKTIELLAGTPATIAPKVHARFVPERLDDFAWENDRTIQRVYGPALQNKPGETSGSGVDVWVKNTASLVMDAWYAGNDYHVDHGEGLDAYSVGTTRGAGGIGIWKDATLYVSKDFVTWKVLANGPLRAVFELTYAPWDAGGTRVSEVKRVTLDAGAQLSLMESTITVDGGGETTVAAGLALGSGAATLAPDQSWATVWQTLEGDNGAMGLALIPIGSTRLEKAAGHVLSSAPIGSGAMFGYYAGGGWSKGGYVDRAAWNTFAEAFAARVHSPLKVSAAP
ncbi:DUF4861 family protein [Sorangium sp. So ce1151]|uniref:DUF4861 family protein n=1 Tax=Sorangium sp. So ce1151 TaxID=3133332 RepID=UPI003F630C81